MRPAVAVPVAAAAALLTLACSGFLLAQTGWQKTQRFSVVDYLDEPQPLAMVPGSAAAAETKTKRALPSFSARDFDGHFIMARPEPVPDNDPTYRRRLLKSLLGMAVQLERTLILPAAMCRCRDANLTDCEGPAVEPFGCPLVDALDATRWQRSSLASFRPPHLLLGALPPDLRRSHVRVLLPDGMDDGEILYALRSYKDTRILEVQQAVNAFCGWDVRMPGNQARLDRFLAAADPLLATSAAGAPQTVPLHRCTHYRGGTGEVLQFINVGQADERHEVTASRDKLPDAVRSLPQDTDIMVTFATGSVATMALNWVAAVRATGVEHLLIGALDQKMMDACELNAVPCILIEGGAVTKALASRRAENVRSDPALYPKMSVLKVGFYRELLSFGFNVWACDAGRGPPRLEAPPRRTPTPDPSA